MNDSDEKQCQTKSIVICSYGNIKRSGELVEALRIGRPSTVFNWIPLETHRQPDSADWFLMLEPDARSVFKMRNFLGKGVPVITVDSEVADTMLDDSCAVVFGPEPTNEEFVRGMLPFLESDYRKSCLDNSAKTKSRELSERLKKGTSEVSVLLLTYNQKDTVARALESVLGQQCDFPYEIILGDDGSTDGTREICEQYAELFPDTIRLMPKTKNKGIVDNYFDCFETAVGKYISDCAGDDYWIDPLRLRKQFNYMTANPEKVAVMSDWFIAEKEKITKSNEINDCPQFRKGFHKYEAISFMIGSNKNFPLLSAMMYRHDVLMGVYIENRSYVRRKSWGCEDLPVIFHLSRHGSIGYCPLTAAVYNINPRGVSFGENDKSYDFNRGVIECILDLCEHYGIDIKPHKKGMNPRLLYLASLILHIPQEDRRLQFRQICSRWPVELPLKLRIYRTAMKSKLGCRIIQIAKRCYKHLGFPLR